MQNWRRPTAFTLVVLIGLYLLGIRIEHPKDGLKNALGPAKTSLVITKKVSKVKAGDKVVVSLVGKPSPVLGIVSGISDKDISIQLNNGFERATNKNIVGKLVIVIPFLGSLLSVVGL